MSKRPPNPAAKIKYSSEIDSEGSAKAKLLAIMSMHSYGRATQTCTECQQDYPCETVKIITQEY